jgi:hypothetical protein
MKVCFNGCSFTVGEGFVESQREHFVYDRLIAKKFQFDSDNIAVSGASNYKIFMSTARAIQTNHYDLVVVQWTSLNRIWLHPGPDCVFMTNHQHSQDFKYRNLNLSSTQQKILRDTLRLLNHDYQNIHDLIDYCKILLSLSQSKTKVIFINGLIPWNNDLITPLTDNLSACLSLYTRQILDFDTRSNAQIIDFFTKLQNKFLELDQTKWVNLFESFQKNTVDQGNDNIHPGPISHAWMASQLENYLINNLQL